MHDPAACGALPAQQARVHIGPVANVESGKLLARTTSSNIAPSIDLAARTELNNQGALVRAITITLRVERFCHSVYDRASEGVCHGFSPNGSKSLEICIEVVRFLKAVRQMNSELAKEVIQKKPCKNGEDDDSRHEASPD